MPSAPSPTCITFHIQDSSFKHLAADVAPITDAPGLPWHAAL